ncbi:MAG: hypothetical protein IPJ65_30595 [Archangiaceae bacterium]|nr:hypothetical protein [Archangiaceae bacterium]
MLPLVTLCVVAAAPVKVAAPGLNAVNLDPKVVEFYGEHLAQQLGFAGVGVVTQREMAQVLGLERQKQLLGCGEDTCVAELAGALGVDGILSGNVAKIAGTFQVNLKVLSASDGRSLASFSARTDDEETILNLLTQGARVMAKDLYAQLGRGPAPQPVAGTVVARGGTVRRFAWAPAALGVALLAVGIATRVIAEGDWSTLHPAPGATVSLETAQRASSDGKSMQLVSAVSFSAAAACLLAAAAMFFFGGESTPAATALVTPDGAAFALAWRLP